MLVSINFLDSLVILFLYMFTYNVSLLVIFWTLQQFISINFKTIFSFSDFKFDFFLITSISIILFSISGVPPFLGFFSKLLILVILVNSNFFFFYIFFFALLFFGLYFYLQNIRFLYSTGVGRLNYSASAGMRLTSIYLNHSFLVLFFILFGFFYIDDLFVYFYWMLS